MQKIYSEIQAIGGEVLVVSFASPDQIKRFLDENPQPFPVVADPERTTYQAFSIGSTNLRGFLRPSVIWKYLKIILRGRIPKRPDANADIWQLGGDFVIDAVGRIRFAYPSSDAVDRPNNAELMKALREC